MYFETLRGRLIARVNGRVRNGEFTERRLAQITGISQPHVHNLLKGVRTLSPEMADRLLRKLKMSVADLLNSAEIADLLSREDLSRGGPLPDRSRASAGPWPPN